jgi:hypothetical protein
MNTYSYQFMGSDAIGFHEARSIKEACKELTSDKEDFLGIHIWCDESGEKPIVRDYVRIRDIRHALRLKHPSMKTMSFQEQFGQTENIVFQDEYVAVRQDPDHPAHFYYCFVNEQENFIP